MIQVDENPLIDALDALDQGLLWLDPDLRVLRHNHAYRYLLELDNPDQFIGQPYSDVLEFLLKRGEFLNHDDEGEFIASRMRAMRAGQPYRIRRLRPNGTLLSVAAKPLTSGGYVFTYLDVTSEAQALEEIQRATKATVVAMANFAEHRDTDTGVHVLRVARLVGQTAHALMVDGQFPANINPTFIETAHVASILHDVGKIATPDSILLKPGPLSDAERAAMMQHSVAGAQLLRQAQLIMGESRYLDMGADISATHHEWFDGNGYPKGLAGEAIPLAGRICAIADVFDALTSRRPYKAPWSTEHALAHIRSLRARQFDPLVTDAFIKVVEEREAVSVVHWTDAMSVGNPHIDEQHMILIDTINQLATAEARADRPVVAMIIDELVAYASFHFSFEEQLMADAAYPVLDQHHRVHQGFSQWILQVREEFFHGKRLQVGERILHFLRDWLRKHILDEDQRYRPYLNNLKPHSSAPN